MRHRNLFQNVLPQRYFSYAKKEMENTGTNSRSRPNHCRLESGEQERDFTCVTDVFEDKILSTEKIADEIVVDFGIDKRYKIKDVIV